MVMNFIKSIFLKTRTFLGDKIKKIFSKPINEETLEELLQLFYGADLGTKVSQKLVEDIQNEFFRDPHVKADLVLDYIKQKLTTTLSEHTHPITLTHMPTVILVVGVNGNGKTTTTAKLAYLYKKQGKSVMLAAADTFRAAAIDQLKLWADKIGVDVIKGQIGSDPAAIAFDSLSAAISRKADVLIIDTAGRLQTKTHLMQELEKIRRVLKKQMPDAPHEVLLVIDATIGQNAIEQAKVFHEHTPLTGLILTKLDGTARGGVVIPIQNELHIPIQFVGVGEQMEDLKPFDPKVFVDELFN